MREAVSRILTELRDRYPGVVEEWTRQRADGNEDWPGFQTEAGLAWWLDSEITQTIAFMADDDTGTERALQQFCLSALQSLHERKDGDADYTE